MLRIKNSTHEAIRYDGATLFLHHAGKPDSEPESVRLLGYPQFEVKSGRDVLVTVPEPKTEWAVSFVFVPTRSYKNWPRPLRAVLQRIGVETRERAYMAYYPK